MPIYKNNNNNIKTPTRPYILKGLEKSVVCGKLLLDPFVWIHLANIL